MAPISKTWRLFKRYAAISLASESEFRTDFFSNIALRLVYAAMMLLFWDGLMRAVGGIPGWSMGDQAMMTGFQMLASVISYLFFHMDRLPAKVLKGELDRYLTKPAPALLCLQWETLPIRSMITDTVSALIVFGVAVVGWGFPLTPRWMLPGLLLAILGALVETCFQTAVSALSFWLGRVDGLQQVLNEVRRFGRFPVTLFGQPGRSLLTWVWTFGLYMTYPVLLMRGEAGQVWTLLGGAALLLLVWFLLLIRLLAAGLRRYESFGG